MMAVTVLLALVFTAVEPQALQTPDPNRIEEVRVTGNRRIPSDTIKYNLQTKPNDQFNPNVIRRDIKTLYALGHFDDIRVEEDQGKTGKIIIFRVTEKKLIRSVKYEGVKSITNSEILEKLRDKKASISQESPYDPTKIRKAETIIKMMLAETKPHQVYRTLPFIRPPFPWGIPIPFKKKTLDRYYITIKIEENDQYRVGDVKVTDAKQYNETVIKAVLGLVPGEVFNEERLRKSFENLKKLYGARGYINFTAVPVQDFDEAKKLVNLNINVDEDRQFYVNRIAFSGNTTTRDKVIRREVMVEEGQVFNSALWDMSLQRLNQLGYFEEIKTEDAEVKPNPTQPQVDINLKVKERGRNSIGFNGGVSGIGGSFMGISYETNNFLGFGETLGVTLQGGTRQSQYVLSFTEPYLFDRPLTAGFSVFKSSFRYDQAREVFGLDPSRLPQASSLENRLNFTQQGSGFNVFSSYPFKIWNRFGLNFGINHSVTSAINPATEEYFKAVTTQNNQSFISNTGAGSFSDFHAHTLIPSFTRNRNQGTPIIPTGASSTSLTVEYKGGFLGGSVK